MARWSFAGLLLLALAAWPRAGAADSSGASPGIRVANIPVRRDSTGQLSLPEIQVVAERWKRSGSAVPLATTVIDRAAIAGSGALSAGEILRPVAGVRVATLGGLGAFAPVSIRGSTNDQVVVLVDGLRQNAAQGGGADLSDLPLQNVERIEVMRGGASALYGPDALGGVINLITRGAPARRSLELKAETGSFDTRMLSGRAAGTLGPVAGWLSGRLLASKGDYPYATGAGADSVRVNARLDSRSVEGGMKLRPAWASRVELRAGHLQAEKGVPGGTQFPSPTATQWDETTNLQADIRGFSPRGAGGVLAGSKTVTSGSAFVRRRIRRYADPGHPLGPVDESHRNDSAGFGVTQARDLGPLGLLHAGCDYREDRLISTTDGRRSRPARSLSLRDVLGGDEARRSLTAALRVDKVGGLGAEVSPRILARLTTGRALEMRLSAGRSFRPPSFDDLFLPARTTAAGNPDLKPEHAVDADLGATLAAGRWTLAATGFASWVTDLIQWEPGAAGVWRPHNVDGARILGVEAELQGSFPAARGKARAWVQANYTFLDPREAGDAPNTGGKVLVYRPRHRANLLLRLTGARLAAETQWRYTGPAFITRANTKTLPAYLTADITLRWRVAPGASLEARGLNLTDEIYQDFRDFPAPGRQWRLALSWNSGD